MTPIDDVCVYLRNKKGVSNGFVPPESTLALVLKGSQAPSPSSRSSAVVRILSTR